MNCYRCHTENEAGAHFCKQCGSDLWAAPERMGDGARRSLNHVLILIGWSYFTYILWFIINKLILTRGMARGIVSTSTLVKLVDWSTSGITVVLSIVFAILSTHRTTRICLIIFAVVRVLLIVGYAL